MSEVSGTYKLEELTTKIGSGATPRGGKNSYKESGISLIRSLNIYDLEFDIDGLAFIDEEQAEKLSNVEVEEDDVLINITGASVARCCKVPSNILPARVNQHVSILRPKKHKLNPAFLQYLLVSPHYKYKLLAYAQGGATREALTKDGLEEFEIYLPPLETQEKIASILSNFDDLIENNSRRIEILEEMARRIYREWFVHFRYPGHQEDELVDSGTELGEIPEGWEVKNVIDLYDTSAGGTPSRKKDEYFDGNIPWLKTKELNDSFIQETEETITKLGLNNSSAKLFPKNSVLVAMYGATVGQLGILDIDATTNQACCAVMEKQEPFDYSYIFYTLLEGRNKLIGLKQGAAQQNINQGIIKEFKILKPPKDILKEFQAKLYPLLDQVSVIKKKNDMLKESRDLLLPKLVSGEINLIKYPKLNK